MGLIRRRMLALLAIRRAFPAHWFKEPAGKHQRQDFKHQNAGSFTAALSRRASGEEVEAGFSQKAMRSQEI
jgi:hypothetical protein